MLPQLAALCRCSSCNGPLHPCHCPHALTALKPPLPPCSTAATFHRSLPTLSPPLPTLPPPLPTVQVFEVELLSWKSVKDIVGDGGVIKTVAREGSGWAKPMEADEVSVR